MFKGRDFLRVTDFSAVEMHRVLEKAAQLKSQQKAGIEHRELAGKSLAMIFEKPSARTRISFEVGMFQLGGNALNVSANEIKMGQRESIADVARTLSRYVDGVLIRSYYHWTIEEFAEHATVPVINGLSDHSHPCQAVADIFTVKEKKGELDRVRVCYIGDGNNVCNSLVEICGLMEAEIVVCCPHGHEPWLGGGHPKLTLESDPFKAVQGADVVYTDVWVSMGQEQEGGRKVQAFRGYLITPELMSSAGKEAIFMHCLPAHRGWEVDESVFESSHSVVFDQAENRLHTQKAILSLLLAN